MKIKIDCKRLTPCSSVKYLGVYIDQHLNWNVHLSELKPKLSRAVGMLSKIRHYVNKETPTNGLFWDIFIVTHLWYTNVGSAQCNY